MGPRISGVDFGIPMGILRYHCRFLDSSMHLWIPVWILGLQCVCLDISRDKSVYLGILVWIHDFQCGY